MKGLFTCKILGLFCLILIVLVQPVLALPNFAVLLADGQSGERDLYLLNNNPANNPRFSLRIVYHSEIKDIHAIAFCTKKLFLVDHNTNDIRLKISGAPENIVYHHSTYIRDLAFNSRGQLFFSEASGAGGDGIIYLLNTQTWIATVFRQIPLTAVNGSWAGNFAFGPKDQLYLSSGNVAPASLFVESRNGFRRLYTDKGPITGFDFLNSETILFTDYGQKLYQLINFQRASLVYQNKRFSWLDNVKCLKESLLKESLLKESLMELQ